jgi:orotate phosphoribosyltransferase-like protein
MIKSGHCKVKGRDTIIIDSLLSSQEQSEVIIQTLKKFDLESIYLPPWIRGRLESENSI